MKMIPFPVRISPLRGVRRNWMTMPSQVVGFSKAGPGEGRLYAHCADGTVWRLRRLWPYRFELMFAVYAGRK